MRFAEFLLDQRIVKPATFIDKPSVSVIMPTYCRARDGLLARAITSVLAQTFADFEFIIVDDGSTDGSEEIVRDFQKQDGRILYVRHKANSGLPALRVDEAILLSRGEHIAFQFDDDEWLPPFLQTLTREAARRNRSFVHCQAEYLVGEQVKMTRFPVTQPTYASLIQGNKLANCSTLVRRSVMAKSGLYDPHVVVRRFTDWDLWIRISQFEPPLLTPQVLVRLHVGLSDSIGTKAPTVEHEDYWLMLRAPRNAELTPESILAYDVTALDRYVGRLPPQAVESLQRHNVVPWLNDHKEHFQRLGILQAAAGPPFHAAQKVADSASYKESSAIAGLNDRLRRFARRRRSLLFTARVMLGCWYRCRTRMGRVSESTSRWLRPQSENDASDAWDTIPADFETLKGDPLVQICRRNGFRLQQSRDLRSIPFLEYPLTISQAEVSALFLAPIMDTPPRSGAIGLQIVDSKKAVVARVSQPIAEVSEHKPVGFFFEPPLKAGEYGLQVFGWRLSAPVRVYELRKSMAKRPFCRLTSS